MNISSISANRSRTRRLVSALAIVVGTIGIEWALDVSQAMWRRLVGRSMGPAWPVFVLILLGGLVALYALHRGVPPVAPLATSILLAIQMAPIVFRWTFFEVPALLLRISSESATYVVIGVLLVGGVARWLSERSHPRMMSQR